jgi:hypothetical protein
MINPFITSELASAHRRDLLQEAEMARLARQGRTTRPGLGTRILHCVQFYFVTLHRRVAGRVGPAEASHATSQVVILGDR